MKILLLYTDLRLGGVQRFILDLCQELGRRGHEVILATHWTEAIDEMSVLNNEKPLFRRVSFGKTSGGFSLGLVWKINRFIWKEKPDVLHTNLFSLLYVSPSAILHLPRKTRFVHTIHNMADKEWPTPWYKLNSYLYLHKTLPVAISEKVQESLMVRYPGIQSPLIFNGCVLDKSGKEPELVKILQGMKHGVSGQARPLFLHIGNISSSKNQVLLARVAGRLCKEGYDFAVAIVGRKDDEEQFAQMEAECDENIRYLGPCKHAQALLREANFFTLCSIYEGMPISLIEAIGNGCVPVCTPAGGIPNGCVDHVNGLLAKESSEGELYRIMKEALELTQEQYEAYRQASLQLFAERFSIEECAQRYEELYRTGVLNA